MAYTAVPFVKPGLMIDADWMNTYVRDNLNALSTHQHTGAAGDGNDQLDGVDQIDLDQIAAPGAPAANKTRVYALTTDSKIYIHPNGGSAVAISENGHTH